MSYIGFDSNIAKGNIPKCTSVQFYFSFIVRVVSSLQLK